MAHEVVEYFEEICRFMDERSPDKPIVGIDEWQIAELESYVGGTLPIVYVEFLKVFGSFPGKWLVGTTCHLERRYELRLRSHAESVLERIGEPPLPRDAFVFLMHQGYIFAWFSITDGEDPPVYSFAEHDPEFSVCKSMSEFFRVQFEAYKEIVTERESEEGV